PPRRGRIQTRDGAHPYRTRLAARGRTSFREGELAMAQHEITLKINGAAKSASVESRLLLVHFLRETLAMTGTHIGCDTTHCGACTVLMDGEPVKSCTVLAVQADGRDVTTVEGLEQGGKLHPLQNGFWQEHGLQCGYCT